MANIINLPDFMLIEKKKFSKSSKLFFFLKGLFVGYFYKKLNGKYFCIFMNFLFRDDGKIFYEDGFYKKQLSNNMEINYPNKRVDRIIVNHKLHFELFIQTYCLQNIDFKKNDLVVDCGANIGELFFALKFLGAEFDYFPFEPDPQNYIALKKNLEKYSISINKLALSDLSGKLDFYLSPGGDDSSIYGVPGSNKITVEAKKLDDYNIPKIKLLKLEAEGSEPEVLKGAKNTLKVIEFIAVDYGPERGIDEQNTAPEVTSYLYKNSFELVELSNLRNVGLFKRKV